jgi:DNA helicase-2/ATP-dependent DNA helicase PcrA
MQLMPGVGPTSAQRVMDHISAAPNPLVALASAPAPPRVGPDWQAFVDLIEQLRGRGLGWPGELEHARQWYEPHLDRIHEDAEVRLGDLLQLEQIAAGYPSRERFLTELTLDPPDATSDQAGAPLLDEDYLILSTIHSAKGQEWTSVFVLNAVDGCIPSDLGAGERAELEEERRLFYVAMTRAKDDLHILTPQRFFVHGQRRMGDRHVYADRTRFIPKNLLGLFQRVSWPVASPMAAAATEAPPTPKVDVGARLKSMWS